ncbi:MULTISPECIES: hypothetical protein [unclassified Nocardioides]|uniref:hypothetical protein n=1 Tax=unclassified Nocardioides TaxID=2615069 RepID=UPI0006FF0182|nr:MULTISPECIES: hypothetical protein [unclassified Nocardioides]KRA38013.1 hypothetical protein ASD81_04855 [Nocardioides sp. Root614]KRA91973.1 hypothetical protein ASD84_05120 [Nocardioides sp. Root682]
MHRLRTASAVVATITLLAGLTACGEDDKAKTDEVVVVKITQKDGTIEPSGDRVDVSAGQPVDLEVTSDDAGTLHVHSDPEQEFAYQAGTETFEIQIDRPGVVAVESHELDQVIVQLEVR